MDLNQLSDDARAVIAGFATAGVNMQGISATDEVWQEIHAAFPTCLFDAWRTDDNYDPEAGW